MLKVYKCKTLLGHNGLDLSIKCLQSFVNNAEQVIHLQIFEDGSITPDDKKKLLLSLPDCVIIEKEVRDNIVKKKLEKFPKCLDYRSNTNYAQKLFDVMLYEDEDVLFIDSDIFFMKKFRLPEFNVEPVFMTDTHNAYSIKPLEFFGVKYPIYPFINSGFFYFPHKMFDLNFIEELLNNKIINLGIARKISWLEQTIWAFLVAKTGNACYFDYDQVVMAQEVIGKPIDEQIIAVHLVFSLRTPAFDVINTITPTAGTYYHDIKLIYIQGYLSKTMYAFEKIRNKWRHLLVKTYIEKNIHILHRPKIKVYR